MDKDVYVCDIDIKMFLELGFKKYTTVYKEIPSKKDAHCLKEVITGKIFYIGNNFFNDHFITLKEVKQKNIS